MYIVTLTEAKNKIKEIFEKVVCDREEVIVHKNEKESAVLISLEEYNSLKETHYLLSNPINREHIKKSLEELKNSNVVTQNISEL